MFSDQNSMIFFGKMLKGTDEILVKPGICDRRNKRTKIVTNEDQLEPKRLIVKFTKFYFDCHTLDHAKEEDLPNELERRHEWKVSFPSSVQTTATKENKCNVVGKKESADDDVSVTLVDVSDPWVGIKDKEERRLKVKKVAEVCESYYNCGENRYKVQSKVFCEATFCSRT